MISLIDIVLVPIYKTFEYFCFVGLIKLYTGIIVCSDEFLQLFCIARNNRLTDQPDPSRTIKAMAEF